MKTDLYTKAVLTVIALCLSIQVFQSIQWIPNVQASGFTGNILPMNADGSLNVRWSDNQEMDVVITGVETYDELEVEVTEISTREPIDVNIDEVGGGFISMGGPLKVEVE
jgi:hypothetical protein